MNEVLVIDVSRHNGFVDVPKAKAAGVNGIKVRVSVGDYYTDPRFRETRDNCYKYDMPVGGYHVVRPDISPLDQLARLYQSLDGDYMTMPFTFDCEVIGALLWTNTVTMARHLDDKTGDFAEIYTALWVTQRVPLGVYETPLSFRPLHVANYTLRDNPAMPEGWLDWFYWQWSSDGNRQGDNIGVDSQDVDLNRFRYNVETFYRYIDKTPDPPSDEVCFSPKLTLGEISKVFGHRAF